MSKNQNREGGQPTPAPLAPAPLAPTPLTPTLLTPTPLASSPSAQAPSTLDTFLLHIAGILGVQDDAKLQEVANWRQCLGKYCNSVDNLKTLVSQSDSWQNIKLDEMVKAQIKTSLGTPTASTVSEYTIEDQADVNIYWFPSRPKKFEHISFTDSIPCFIDFENKLSSFASFLRETKEYNALSLFLPPGTGKTTITRLSAIVAECFYVRLTTKRGILSKMKALMLSQCRVKNPGIEAWLLEKRMYIISVVGLNAIFDLILEIINQGNAGHSIIELVGNGLECNLLQKSNTELDELLEKEEDTAQQRFEKIISSSRRTLVLHFDELQDWALDCKVAKFRRKRDNERIRQKEVKNYLLSCFSEAVQRAVSGPIKLVFSGTMLTLSLQLRLSSALKQYPITVEPSDLTFEVVIYLLKTCCNINDEELAKKLIGPGRVIQYFIMLRLLYQNETNEKCLLEALRKTFCYVKEDADELKVSSDYWDRLVILCYNYRSLGGSVTQEGYIFPKSVLQQYWFDWASCGLFKFRAISDHEIEFPFLTYCYRWFARSMVKKINEKDERVLSGTLVTGLHTNATNLGYTFSTAIAIDLLSPHSGFYKVIKNKFNYLIPLPRKNKALEYLSNEKEIMRADPYSIVICKDDRKKGTKYGDISFCMENTNIYYNNNNNTTTNTDANITSTLIYCRIEAKKYNYEDETKGKVCSKLLGECLAFFDKKSNANLKIFVSYKKFLDWAKDGNLTVNKALLEEFLRRDDCLVIDGVDEMEDTILNYDELLNEDTDDITVSYNPSQDFPMDQCNDDEE